MLTELKREAYEANVALPKHGLINLTFGNASAIDRAKGLFAIKPSGVAYEDLKVSDMVLVDLEGKKAEGNLIQLHPVLNVEWLDKPTEEFTVPKETPAKPPAPAKKPTKPTKSSSKTKMF